MEELPASRSVPRRLYLAFELAVLFIGLPAVMWAGYLDVHVLVALWAITAVCFVVLLLDPTFARRRLWNAERLGPELRTVRAIIAS